MWAQLPGAAVVALFVGTVLSAVRLNPVTAQTWSGLLAPSLISAVQLLLAVFRLMALVVRKTVEMNRCFFDASIGLLSFVQQRLPTTIVLGNERQGLSHG